MIVALSAWVTLQFSIRKRSPQKSGPYASSLQHPWTPVSSQPLFMICSGWPSAGRRPTVDLFEIGKSALDEGSWRRRRMSLASTLTQRLLLPKPSHVWWVACHAIKGLVYMGQLPCAPPQTRTPTKPWPHRAVHQAPSCWYAGWSPSKHP